MSTLKKAVGFNRDEKDDSKQTRRRWTPEDKRKIVDLFNNKELRSPPGKPGYVIDPINNTPVLIVQIKTWAKSMNRQNNNSSVRPTLDNGSTDFLNQLADLVTEKVILRMKQNL